MASVVDKAASDPDVRLISLDPLIEMHLHLIISLFEEGNRGKKTEDSIFCSMFGDIGKHESNLASFRTSSMTYGAMADEEVDLETGEWVDTGQVTVVEGPAGGEASIQTGVVGTFGETGDAFLDFTINPPDTNPDGSPNIFAQCFPCEHRLTILAEGMPLPDWSLGYQKYIDQIKNFINQILQMLNPVNFYADICMFIDMLRIVCPQDLVLLLGMLGFLLTKYLTLSLKIDIDWISLVGMILLPLLLLIVSLLDMMISVGLNPMTCLQDLLEFMKSFVSATGEIATNFGGSISDMNNYVKEFGANTEAGASLSPGESHIGKMPIRNEMLDDKMKGLLGTMGSVDMLILSLSSVQIRIPAFFNMLKDILECLIEMINEGVLLKLQIMLGMLSLVKLIGLIIAVISLIDSGDICTDPTIPLSEDDVKNVIDRMKQLSGPAGTTGAKGFSVSSGLSPTVDVTFDSAGSGTGNIIVTNLVTNQSTKVPMCLGKVDSTTRNQINEWIEQLDAVS